MPSLVEHTSVSCVKPALQLFDKEVLKTAEDDTEPEGAEAVNSSPDTGQLFQEVVLCFYL